MAQRGKIINRERAKQLRDYSGLKYGKITPTDIDGFIDFGNKAFVFLELKLEGTKLPYGQRLALERIGDTIEEAGKECLVVVAEHNTSLNRDIDVANCKVILKRQNKQWFQSVNSQISVKEIIDDFLKKCSLDYYLVKEPKKEDLDKIVEAIPF